MKKTPINFLTSIFLISITPPAAFAITWGTPDGTGHPYVGILYFETSAGIYRRRSGLMG
jgi:hypothetical protein